MRVSALFAVMLLLSTSMSATSAVGGEVTPYSNTDLGFWTKHEKNTVVIINEFEDTVETNLHYLYPDSIRFICEKSRGIYFLLNGHMAWISMTNLTDDPIESTLWPSILENGRRGKYRALYEVATDLIESNFGDKTPCILNNLIYQLRFSVPYPGWDFPSSSYGVYWCLLQTDKHWLKGGANDPKTERLCEQHGRNGAFHPPYIPCHLLLY